MEFMAKLSFLVLVVSFLLCINFQGSKNNNIFQISCESAMSENYGSRFTALSPTWPGFTGKKLETGSKSSDEAPKQDLEYDFYRESCPQAYPIIRSTLQALFEEDSTVAPALLRLVFHDCIVQGCDASVLLDPAEGVNSEKTAGPNLSLRGHDQIDIIKSKLEDVCPGIVSCADILVVAARESVLLAGGPFYPLRTGRRDSNASFHDLALSDIPSPVDDLQTILTKFARKGFNERETVSLLGAHSIGKIHCSFIDRIKNDKPDQSMDPAFAKLLRSKCNINPHTASPPSPISTTSTSPSPSPISTTSTSTSPSPISTTSTSTSPSPISTISTSSSPSPSASSDTHASSPDPAVNMDYEGPSVDFGTLYYQSLLQRRGILTSDQELTAGDETLTWVRAYALDSNLFKRDFGLAMMKLSETQVLTAPLGHIRCNCRRLV